MPVALSTGRSAGRSARRIAAARRARLAGSIAVSIPAVNRPRASASACRTPRSAACLPSVARQSPSSGWSTIRWTGGKSRNEGALTTRSAQVSLSPGEGAEGG